MVDRQGGKRSMKRERKEDEGLASSLSSGMVWHGSIRFFEERTGLHADQLGPVGPSTSEALIHTFTYLVAL